MINCLYCNKNQTQSFLTVKTPNILQASSFERAKLGKIIQQEIYLCPNCYLGFSQSNEIESYDYKEYHYLSPSSGLGHEQYKNFLNLLIKHSKPSDNILEIGCSDGHLLQQLKQKGFSSLSGIEPGPLADLALAKNLNVKRPISQVACILQIQFQ